MKYKTTIKKIGSSDFIIIPKAIENIIDAKEKDVVEVSIEKVNGETPIITYKCKKCGHIFDLSQDEIPYCPACDCDDIDTYTSEKEVQ